MRLPQQLGPHGAFAGVFVFGEQVQACGREMQVHHFADGTARLAAFAHRHQFAAGSSGAPYCATLPSRRTAGPALSSAILLAKVIASTWSCVT